MFVGQAFCVDKPAVVNVIDDSEWKPLLRGAAFPIAGAACGLMAGISLYRATDGIIPWEIPTILGAFAGGIYTRNTSMHGSKYKDIYNSYGLANNPCESARDFDTNDFETDLKNLNTSLRNEDEFRFASDFITSVIFAGVGLSLMRRMPQVTVYLKNDSFDKVVKG
jgi:hypothetical protein